MRQSSSMKPVNGPDPRDPVQGMPDPDWVEATQLDFVMRGLRFTWVAAVAVMLLVAGLSISYIVSPVLWVWVAGWTVLAIQRYRVMRHYVRVVSHRSVPDRLAFFRRHRRMWQAYAMSWGVGPLVFATALPDAVEVACWLVIAGSGAVSLSWMSAHMPTVRSFLKALTLTTTISVGLDAMTSGAPRDDVVFSALLPLGIVVFWMALWRLVLNLHRLFDQSIELRYQNEHLIESLRKQTRAAQDALVFRDKFLAGAAHDLKQPIHALGIYAEWLSAEPELVDQLSPKIQQSTQAINSLFDSLFDLVKLDAGHLSVELAPVKVAALMSELEVQFRPLAARKGLTLRVRSLDIALLSDPIMLRRILANLVTNAIRYTREGGLLLAVRRRPNAIDFEVWDTGIGIGEDEQARIFDEFYRAPNGGREDGFGLGLGLAIVRRLSASLGYTLTMRSRLGQGTVFGVRVPLTHAEDGASLTDSVDRSSVRSARSASGS